MRDVSPPQVRGERQPGRRHQARQPNARPQEQGAIGKGALQQSVGLSGRERHRLLRRTVSEIALNPAVPELPSRDIDERDIEARDVHFKAKGDGAALRGGEAVGRAATAAAVAGFEFSHESGTHQVVHEARDSRARHSGALREACTRDLARRGEDVAQHRRHVGCAHVFRLHAAVLSAHPPLRGARRSDRAATDAAGVVGAVGTGRHGPRLPCRGGGAHPSHGLVGGP